MSILTGRQTCAVALAPQSLDSSPGSCHCCVNVNPWLAFTLPWDPPGYGEADDLVLLLTAAPANAGRGV